MIWIVWGIALGLAVVVLAILGYGLFAQLKRLQRAVDGAASQLVPALQSLQSDATSGRHRAG